LVAALDQSVRDTEQTEGGQAEADRVELAPPRASRVREDERGADQAERDESAG
jgi:hypothetical protein